MTDKDDEEYTVTNDTLNRWVKEYLQELQNAHRYPNKKQQSSQIQEGDMVVEQYPDLPRGFWKLAKVMRLLTGQVTTLQRPVRCRVSDPEERRIFG